MVLKCADIGHLAASPRTHRRWAYQLEEEFFRQGDQERDVGLPVSPLMDRSTKGGMTRSQVGRPSCGCAYDHALSVCCRCRSWYHVFDRKARYARSPYHGWPTTSTDMGELAWKLRACTICCTYDKSTCIVLGGGIQKNACQS